jgi:hypothetical protein
MEKTITTTFMIIISVISAVLVFNAILPAVTRSRDSMVTMRGRLDERIKSKITVIHATGELDQDALWQDTNGNGNFDLFVWVKNIGAVRNPAVDSLDIFFGPEGNFVRIPYKDAAAGSYPYWEWTLENDTSWNPSATLKITIRFATTLSSERYFIKIVLPNGVNAGYTFSI